jgi:hypothetical protein
VVAVVATAEEVKAAARVVVVVVVKVVVKVVATVVAVAVEAMAKGGVMAKEAARVPKRSAGGRSAEGRSAEGRSSPRTLHIHCTGHRCT